jgi:hypothetical protein
MIAARAGQLTSAIRAFKAGNVGKLEQALRLNRQSDRRKVRRENGEIRVGSKTGANAWLELHFGWVPLCQDIFNAVQVLSSNPPANRVKATARYTELVKESFPPTTYPINWAGISGNAVYGALVQADVYVSNPNLALANQLGLVNPATVAWELVPFSFLVDWFYPVGAFLDSFSDLLGYKIEYPMTTTLRKVDFVQRNVDQPSASSSRRDQRLLQNAVRVKRTLGIPPYVLRTVPFKGFSVARGATAISLVIQQFLSLR